MRSLVAWLLTIPLIGSGLFLTHVLSYRVAEPHAHERAELLAESGHGYFDYAPLAAAFAASLLLLAVVTAAARAFRGELAIRLRLWPFAVLSPLAFAVQEHVERLVHSGELPLSTALNPTFALGLLIQAPFALAAFLLARALLDVARRLGALLGPARTGRTALVFLLPPPGADPARRPVLGRGYAGRAPPSLLAA